MLPSYCRELCLTHFIDPRTNVVFTYYNR